MSSPGLSCLGLMGAKGLGAGLGRLPSGHMGAWEWPGKWREGCSVKCQADPRICAPQSLTGRKGATRSRQPSLAPVSSPEGLEPKHEPQECWSRAPSPPLP